MRLTDSANVSEIRDTHKKMKGYKPGKPCNALPPQADIESRAALKPCIGTPPLEACQDSMITEAWVRPHKR